MEDGPYQVEYSDGTQRKGNKQPNKKTMAPVGFSKVEEKQEDGIQQFLSLEGIPAGPCHLSTIL